MTLSIRRSLARSAVVLAGFGLLVASCAGDRREMLRGDIRQHFFACIPESSVTALEGLGGVRYFMH